MASFGNIDAIVSTVKRSDMNEVFASRYDKRVPVGIDQPDYPCFLAYASFMLAQVSRKWPEATKVNFFIERKKKISHHIMSFREELEEWVEPELRPLVGDLTAVSRDLVLPLQSADALLWHLQRYYASGEKQSRMDPTDAIRLAGLIQDGDLDGMVHTWDRSELEAMAEKWEIIGVIPFRPQEQHSCDDD
jgi:hypothetical protein